MFMAYFSYSGDSEICETSSTSEVEIEIINQLKDMLDSQNQLVKTYRMVRDTYEDNPQVELKLRLIGKRSKDGRKYNLPTASEVAALIIGDFEDNIEPRDIVVRTKAGPLQRINELHPSYLALQYPLLFPFGEDCYHVDILHRDVILDQSNPRNKKCTMREYFCYRIQDRVSRFSLILNSRRLFQQFLVDAYTMIEAQRLWFVRNKQSTLRCSTYKDINDAQTSGDTDLSKKGQRVILPSSFTGGARYMLQNYLDAMSICKWYGYPDFFITMTCNPKWPEMRRYLANTTLLPEDKPNILSRLFKMKLDSLITDLKRNSLLGRVQAGFGFGFGTTDDGPTMDMRWELVLSKMVEMAVGVAGDGDGNGGVGLVVGEGDEDWGWCNGEENWLVVMTGEDGDNLDELVAVNGYGGGGR
ncbi:hypothetical protein SSX86_020788 [Deinandra increscens subsp. villosa]|uniref:Helitron helicase-like domain-containing protein n=1 Tax=Deinandra increscens subsp. villosa TaxID=3103831 RepID=A0AAP0CVK7_9ASTR